jgi:hypothetical protein
VREAMLTFLRTEMPQALVRGRQTLERDEAFTRRSGVAG